MKADKDPRAPITALLEEVATFDADLFPPTREICEYDEVLGDCPTELQRFFAYSRFCEREMKSLSVDIEFSTQKDDVAMSRLYQLNKKRDVALCLFWFAVWEYFDCYDTNKEIGVRSGWKVVLHDRQRPEMPPFLRGLFGFGPVQE